jgi:hypothetical protein
MADKATAQTKKAVTKRTVATAKKTTTKAASKSPATRAASKKTANKGDSFVCDVCGLSVIVDEWGDVVGAQEILCCGQTMKQRTRKATKVPAK